MGCNNSKSSGSSYEIKEETRGNAIEPEAIDHLQRRSLTEQPRRPEKKRRLGRHSVSLDEEKPDYMPDVEGGDADLCNLGTKDFVSSYAQRLKEKQRSPAKAPGGAPLAQATLQL